MLSSLFSTPHFRNIQNIATQVGGNESSCSISFQMNFLQVFRIKNRCYEKYQCAIFNTILLPFTQTNFSSTLLTLSTIDQNYHWWEILAVVCCERVFVVHFGSPSCSLISKKGCKNQTQFK